MNDGSDRKGVVRRWLGFAGKVVPPPAEAIDFRSIRAGGRLVADLVAVIRASSAHGSEAQNPPNKPIDLAGIGAAIARSSGEMATQVLRRRDETRKAAVLAFWTAWALLGLWVCEATLLPWKGSRVLSACEFLPFCFGLFAIALRNAWINWQLRTGRLGSLIDYIKTTEPFLPT